MLSVTPQDGPDGCLQLHASTVVIDGKAVAFVGPSGVGKSSFALACLSRGALLLADDITWLMSTQDALIATCPDPIRGRIEARGLGLLNADVARPTVLHLIVDLGALETKRLPEPKFVYLGDHRITVLHRVEGTHFIDAILHYVHHGKAE